MKAPQRLLRLMVAIGSLALLSTPNRYLAAGPTCYDYEIYDYYECPGGCDELYPEYWNPGAPGFYVLEYVLECEFDFCQAIQNAEPLYTSGCCSPTAIRAPPTRIAAAATFAMGMCVFFAPPRARVVVPTRSVAQEWDWFV